MKGRMVRQGTFALTGLLLLTIWPGHPHVGAAAQITPAPVLAEAQQQANVRAGPSIEYPKIGGIRAGAHYRVIGRHEAYPWLLIEFGDPVQPGWVYADLLIISGDLNQVPYVRDDTAGVMLAPTIPILTATPPPQATASPTPSGVMARPIDRANVRFGPGLEYPPVGTITAEASFPVLSRHALYPWLQIAYPHTPAGVAWVYQELVEVTGDLRQVPLNSAVEVPWPTLTPTPPVVVTARSAWDGAPMTAGAAGPVDMAALGEAVLGYLYARNYLPRTDRQGSAFALNLQTGESFSLNPGVAYSGMSLIKIPVLVTYFRNLEGTPSAAQAGWIAGMMICSNNPASNAILRELGGGDEYDGALRVTETMRELGLQDTFLLGPLVEDPELSAHENVQSIVTSVDQVSTDPDPYNQTTPDEIGWLLGAIYRCGQQESGPLLERIDGLTPTECRRILYALDDNYLGAMIEAGVPYGATVAHKHGWTTGDTHGDAAIVLSPSGDYVFVIVLHQRDWLTYLDAWPNIAEISRLVYNTFNPQAPLDAIHPETVPETCNLEGHPLLEALTRPDLPPLQ